MTWKEAERRAKMEFGGMDAISEAARDARGVGWIDVVRQDLRYAWRGLRTKPAFAAGVILTLGLGTGANTAMFGIVDRLLLRAPARLEDAGRVHRVYVSYLWNGTMRTERNFEYPRFLDLQRSTRVFDGLVAFDTRQLAVGSGDGMREMTVTSASASLFDLFDVAPVIGRFFTADEDALPAGEHVVVLSHAYWQSAYGGGTDALGRTISIGDGVYTVIGVAPPGFVGLSETDVPALFIPITTFAWHRTQDFADNYGWSWLEIAVRRRPDVSLEAAHADLTRVYAESWERQRANGENYPPAAEARVRGEAGPVLLGRGPMAGPESRVIAWVMGVAVIVLLVACANVINLLLARSVTRRREVALRLALGVSRRRLVQQLMTETVLLAALGGVVGLAVAQWGGQTLRALFLPEESLGTVAGDSRTLLFTAAITLLLALMTGLAPALNALRSDVAGALKSGARDTGYRGSALRSGLLLVQGVLSVVLLVGAGLFVRSLQNVRSLRLGYDVDPVVLAEGTLRGVEIDRNGAFALMDRLLDAAKSVPGVQHASPVMSVPFWSNEGRGAPYVEGRDSLARLGRFVLQAGSPEYFDVLGTRILRGRAFTSADRADAPFVVVVSESMANALWPGQDAVGRQMRIGPDTMPFLTVVGVAEPMHGLQLEGEGEFWYFLPMEQYRRLFGAPTGTMLVRVNGNAIDYVEALRTRLQREMPGASYVSAVPLRDLVAPRQRAWRFGATMFVAFAALALTLAAIGLYSVVAYAVAARTRELGVRIALGASLMRLARQIIGQGVVFAAAGIVIGGTVAFAAARWVEPLLFDTRARDPLVFVAVTGILLLVALLATLRPAWRAARVDPVRALRMD
jgi:predicted permease